MHRLCLNWICFFVVVVVAFEATAFTVSGTIEDASGTVVPGTLVDIRKPEIIGSSVVEYAETNAAGFYSSTNGIQSGADIFIRVRWQFPLGATHNHRVIKLRKYRDGTATTTYTEASSPKSTISGNMTINLAANESLPPGITPAFNVAALMKERILAPLDFIAQQKLASSSWEHDSDIDVYIEPLSTRGSFYRPDGAFVTEAGIHLREDTVDGTPGAANNDIVYHEMGHLIHDQLGGDLAVIKAHFFNTESNAGGAFAEGFASFLAVAVADHLGEPDSYYAISRDDGGYVPSFPALTLWRGDEPAGQTTVGASANPTGNAWESGENIEGAVSAVLLGTQSVGPIGFGKVFEAVYQGEASTLWEWMREFVTLNGVGSAEVLAMYEELQEHGVVYTRLAILTDSLASRMNGFDEEEPSADLAEGNVRLIDGFVFLRGVVTVKIGMETAGGLGAGNTVEPRKAKVGWKLARDGHLEEYPSFFSSWTPAVGGLPQTADIDWDTTPVADDDYDVLIQSVENADGFEDNFTPTWGPAGGGHRDGNSDLESDERYLKRSGAWFDNDSDASTQDDGKVILDNTAPTISNAWPGP